MLLAEATRLYTSFYMPRQHLVRVPERPGRIRDADLAPAIPPFQIGGRLSNIVKQWKFFNVL